MLAVLALLFILYRIPFWLLAASRIGHGRSLIGSLVRGFMAYRTLGLLRGHPAHRARGTAPAPAPGGPGGGSGGGRAAVRRWAGRRWRAAAQRRRPGGPVAGRRCRWDRRPRPPPRRPGRVGQARGRAPDRARGGSAGSPVAVDPRPVLDSLRAGLRPCAARRRSCGGRRRARGPRFRSPGAVPSPGERVGREPPPDRTADRDPSAAPPRDPSSRASRAPGQPTIRAAEMPDDVGPSGTAHLRRHTRHRRRRRRRGCGAVSTRPPHPAPRPDPARPAPAPPADRPRRGRGTDLGSAISRHARPPARRLHPDSSRPPGVLHHRPRSDADAAADTARPDLAPPRHPPRRRSGAGGPHRQEMPS